MGYIVDFEAYQVCSMFYPKEIAFLNIHTNECFQYYIRWPWHVWDMTTHWQLRRHAMDWSEGKYTINEAVDDAQQRILLSEVLYVKGDQKLKYLQKHWFPRNTIKEITCAPSLKNLNSFHDKTCFMHYGKKFCARRKVYELRPYIHNLLDSVDDLCQAAASMHVDEDPLPAVVHNYNDDDIYEDVKFDCGSDKSNDLGFYDADDSDDITD